jgi:hypothetical protein
VPGPAIQIQASSLRQQLPLVLGPQAARLGTLHELTKLPPIAIIAEALSYAIRRSSNMPAHQQPPTPSTLPAGSPRRRSDPPAKQPGLINTRWVTRIEVTQQADLGTVVDHLDVDVHDHPRNGGVGKLCRCQGPLPTGDARNTEAAHVSDPCLETLVKLT